MTTEEAHKFCDLIDMLWDGQVGEVEFYELATDLGADWADITQALNDVREEDGVL